MQVLTTERCGYLLSKQGIHPCVTKLQPSFSINNDLRQYFTISQ